MRRVSGSFSIGCRVTSRPMISALLVSTAVACTNTRILARGFMQTGAPWSLIMAAPKSEASSWAAPFHGLSDMGWTAFAWMPWPRCSIWIIPATKANGCRTRKAAEKTWRPLISFANFTRSFATSIPELYPLRRNPQHSQKSPNLLLKVVWALTSSGTWDGCTTFLPTWGLLKRNAPLFTKNSPSVPLTSFRRSSFKLFPTTRWFMARDPSQTK